MKAINHENQNHDNIIGHICFWWMYFSQMKLTAFDPPLWHPITWTYIMAIFESSLLLQTIMLGIQPLIFSGVDKSSDQFLIQERVQVLVVGGVEVSVHRLAGAKKWCYFLEVQNSRHGHMEMWKSMDFHSLKFLTWHRAGMWPVYWGRKPEGFISMFFDQAEHQWCKCHSCKVVEDRAGQICTWRIGWWVPCGWIHSIHYLRTYQVVPQIWNTWLVNLE